MNQRRLESRFLCADLVRVSWTGAEGNVRTSVAILEDISHVGGSVQTEEAIPPGVAIRLTIGEWIFNGQVCYCRYRDDGYFTGIRFSEESYWSSDQVMPQHLINLQTLGADS
jgi:hypothetical protein